MFTANAAAQADTAFQERVAAALSENDGWDSTHAALIAERLELSFALHDATGTLEQRIDTLRGLSGKVDAQDVAVAHPGYLDAILIAPDTYPAAIRRLGLDHYGEAALLAAILRRPTGEGLRDSAGLIDRFGADLTKFAPEPAFPDLFEALSWVADDAPPGLLDWLGKRLHEASPDDIVMLTELFITHSVPLRDSENAAQLEAAWQALADVRRTNPALFDLLLSHRAIWQTVATPDFTRAMEQQMQHGVDHVRNSLVLLLGRNGALYEMSKSLDWPAPLTDGRMETALEIFQANHGATMDTMFYYRENAYFWQFAKDEDLRALLPCLVKKAKDKLDTLEPEFTKPKTVIELECEPETSILVRSIPGHSGYSMIKKMIAGAPVEVGDIAALSFDVATTLVPIGKLGVVGRLVPGLRLGGKTAKTVGQSLAKATTTTGTAEATFILKEGFGATVSNAIRTEANRVAKLGMQTGLGRAFGVTHQAVTKAMAANPRLSAVTTRFAEDYAEDVSGEYAVNALSTEFLRCTSQPASLTQTDAICQDVVSAVLSAPDMEAAP